MIAAHFDRLPSVNIIMRSFTDHLLQLEGSAAYNLTVDPDVHAIDANTNALEFKLYMYWQPSILKFDPESAGIV